MTAITFALTWLRRVPRDIWFLVAGVALVVCGYFAVLNYGAEKYNSGKRAAAQGIVFDSVTLARAAERVAKANAHTDTITRNVVKTRWKIDTLVRELPPDVAAIPEVNVLVTSVRTLTVQVDSLTTAHAAERLATIERARVDSSAIYALRVMNTAQRDTIVQLQKRPTRLKAAVYTVIAGALGVVAGVVK